MRIAFFGSSILSSYWNGAATYYRGLLRSLADLGHEITFYEPDAYGRQQNRDVDNLPWIRSVVYSADQTAVEHSLREAAASEVIVKASGVGIFDELLETRIALFGSEHVRIFWDVDAPATLERVLSNETDLFRASIPEYSAIFTYGGGQRVVETYLALGAKSCTPIYNAVDPDTHFPTVRDSNFECVLGFQGNRLPDRESRVDEFFFKPAALRQPETFLLGGSGWDEKPKPANVRYVGHVSTQVHNAFNSSARFVLNINRDSMASYGFSPPTRVFEAAAAGACLITDAWEGIEMFLEPGAEILVAQDGDAVAEIVKNMSCQAAKAIGDAGRRRILAEHTYRHRAMEVNVLLRELLGSLPSTQKVYA